MSETWRLKRTVQCAKCPWKKSTNPHEIPNGYSVEKHKGLKCTIAEPGSLAGLRGGGTAMACHETDDAHCVGWLAHQLGPGNNIGLRMRMMSCENARDLRLVGEQHERFEDTLPGAGKEIMCRSCGYEGEASEFTIDSEDIALCECPSCGELTDYVFLE